jgi:hypothetical protein
LSNVASGSIFYFSGAYSVDVSDGEFTSSGGALAGGIFYFHKCRSVVVSNSLFESTFAGIGTPRGGSIYALIAEVDGSIVGRNTSVVNCTFRECKAETGLGGSIYLEVLGACPSDPLVDIRAELFYLSNLIFTNNSAINRTNLFVEAYCLDYLVTKTNTVLDLTVSMVGLNEYVGWERNVSGPENYYRSLVPQLLDSSDGVVYIITGGEAYCEDTYGTSGVNAMICGDLANAFDGSGYDLKVELVSTVDLNDLISVIGKVVIVSSLDRTSYAVLVVGQDGVFYVESGEDLFEEQHAQRLSNSISSSLKFEKTEFRFQYNSSVVAHAFVVVVNGVVLFDDCKFISNKTSATFGDYVSVYIADTYNDGTLILNNCVVSELNVKGKCLINAQGDSNINISV